MAAPVHPRMLPEAIDLVGRTDVRVIHEGEMWRLISAVATDSRLGEEVLLYLRQGAQTRIAHVGPHERVILV